MTHILTIETKNETDFAQIKGLAERLGAHIEEQHTETGLTEAEEIRLLQHIRWEGEETGDELNAMIQGARHFGTRDVEL